MKPTAVFLTVMLLVTGTLFIGGSFTVKNKAETYIPDCDVLGEIPLKKEDTMLLLPADHKEAVLQKTNSSDLAEVYIKPSVCEGNRDDGNVIPPPIEKEDSAGIIYSKVEVEAEYPGGAAAWQRYLNRNLRYPQEDIDNEMLGSVLVQFVVDEEGNISNVEALKGSKALGDEAVRVIKKSGKWIPAVQNGHYVKSLKKQPIMVHLEVEE